MCFLDFHSLAAWHFELLTMSMRRVAGKGSCKRRLRAPAALLCFALYLALFLSGW
jgi:hypothetical protein